MKLRTQRATKTLLERYAQHEARMEAMEKLRSIGTEDAIYGLARRFSSTAENLGTDQDEKRRVRDVLVAFGDEAIEPLKRYIKGHDKVTWAVDALSELMSRDALIAFLFEALHKGDPVFIRGGKAVELIEAIRNAGEPGVVPELIECLSSDDDTVRFASIESLEHFADEAAREPILELLVSENEDSMRVKTRAAQALMKLSWDVKGYRKKVEEQLPEPYRLNSKGRIYE